MRILAYMVQKEFLQIFRNRAMLPIIFVMPVVQLLVLTHAADFEIRNIRYVFLDADRSVDSMALLARFEASPSFLPVRRVDDFRSGMDALDRNEATLLLRIPPRFGERLQRTRRAPVMLDINSIDGQAANLAFSYAAAIVRSFTAERHSSRPSIDVEPRYWFNPEMEYHNLMVPGILALLITMIGMFLSSMNIVREKEIGTIEQINVTPISKPVFLVGKLLPLWVIALFELAFGLLIGWTLFQIPINGSVALLFAYASIYLVAILGFGLLISTWTNTQQQAMFQAWFFMVIFILMSGLFTPIENMPGWAQRLTWVNPVAHIVEVVRAVLLRGSTLADIRGEFLFITAFATVMLSVAVRSYRKRA